MKPEWTDFAVKYHIAILMCFKLWEALYVGIYM